MYAIQHCFEINVKEKFSKDSVLYLSMSLVLGTKTVVNFSQPIKAMFHCEMIKLIFS